MKAHVLGALVILFAGAFARPAHADLFSVTDVNSDPDVFECDLTASEKDVTIGGSTVHALVFKDESAAVPPASAGIPIQVIRVKVGDMVIARFKNNLSSLSASIHWHGIELDNDSDGTAVTQDAVLPGQSYTYQFLTFRPGIFWFHSHMLPGNTLFAGMYGVIIIENDIEPSLKGTVLPQDADTFTLALSDIQFDGTGKVGKPFGGGTKTLNELVELCHLDGIGDPGGDNAACNASTVPGTTVLVNGQTPDATAQTPKFTVPSGKRIRLQLFNESISRHFRLKLLNSGNNNLYRIGGQGGLLDNVILEGGTKGTWDTKFNSGEIVLGSGMRADVIIVPSGNQGDIIQLVGNPLPDPPFKISGALPANYPIAYFQISGTSTDTAPAAGDPILAGTAEDIENVKTATVVNLIDPVPAPFAPGSSDETIRFTTATPTGPGTFVKNQPAVDRFAAMLDSNAGNGDFLTLARPTTARYAHVGDILELTVRNETNATHPYHLHGFSMQPVRMVDNASGTTLYNFDYDEFLDTIDVYSGQSFVFRVPLDDRPKICDLSPSYPPGPVLASCSNASCRGGVGRWLFHCHILSHGALGMISELTVLPGADTPPTISDEAVDKTSLWPPNHTLRDVTVDYTVTDDCGATCVLSVSSNEPANGLGDGDTAPDWEVVDDHHVRLRAERAGAGAGRVYRVTITCTDDAGQSAVKTVTVNVAHNITAPKSGSAHRVGTPVNFSGIFWDEPGRTHTARWSFDSLSTAGTVGEPLRTRPGSVAGVYTFGTTGVYAVKMDVTDVAAGTTFSTDSINGMTALVVVYDPNGGFVSGGGWIDSPPGALASNPGLSGKVNFGFVSKYFKSATNPRGETQINFKLANFSFNALNFDYLVIAGARAQYKGMGKLNGSGGYNFILTVIDGQAANGGGVDLFRIKIWNKSTGAVAYDNQMGAPDNASPTTPVGDGSSIVIQP